MFWNTVKLLRISLFLSRLILKILWGVFRAPLLKWQSSRQYLIILIFGDLCTLADWDTDSSQPHVNSRYRCTYSFSSLYFFPSLYYFLPSQTLKRISADLWSYLDAVPFSEFHPSKQICLNCSARPLCFDWVSFCAGVWKASVGS